MRIAAGNAQILCLFIQKISEFTGFIWVTRLQYVGRVSWEWIFYFTITGLGQFYFAQSGGTQSIWLKCWSNLLLALKRLSYGGHILSVRVLHFTRQSGNWVHCWSTSLTTTLCTHKCEQKTPAHDTLFVCMQAFECAHKQIMRAPHIHTNTQFGVRILHETRCLVL